MSVLAWWVIPVTVALLVGAIVRTWGRRPRFRRSFEEVEYFKSFLNALARSAERAERGDHTTA
jgi:ABC-type Fe3+ transport system permease subunit